MSNNHEHERFAFGSNKEDGYPCPALAAGYNPGKRPENTVVAGKYDEKVAAAMEFGWGTVSEREAKEAWLKVLREQERKGALGDSLKKEFARKVAAELGWLEDES
jgi:hypothetical protein